jgi:hypothetical protein
MQLHPGEISNRPKAGPEKLYKKHPKRRLGNCGGVAHEYAILEEDEKSEPFARSPPAARQLLQKVAVHCC